MYSVYRSYHGGKSTFEMIEVRFKHWYDWGHFPPISIKNKWIKSKNYLFTLYAFFLTSLTIQKWLLGHLLR